MPRLVRSRLSEMIEQCLVHTENGDPYRRYNKLLFELKKGKVTVVGTNGHCLLACCLELPTEYEVSAIIPNGVAKVAAKHKGPITIAEDDDPPKNKWLVLEGKNRRQLALEAHIGPETFPKYHKVVERELVPNTKVGINGQQLMDAMKLCKTMAGDSNAIRLDAQDGAVSLLSSSPDLGECRYEVENPVVKGAKVSIGMRITYLQNYAKFHTEDRIWFDILDPGVAIHIYVDGLDDRFALMPVRL